MKCAALLLLAGTVAVCAPATAKISSCEGLDGRQTRECEHKLAEAADRELNLVYRRVLAKIDSYPGFEYSTTPASVHAEFVTAQRNWIRYRDGDSKMTRERTANLREY